MSPKEGGVLWLLFRQEVSHIFTLMEKILAMPSSKYVKVSLRTYQHFHTGASLRLANRHSVSHIIAYKFFFYSTLQTQTLR